MRVFIEFIVSFIVVFILMFLLYYFFINKKKIKRGYSKLKMNDEVVIFINRYNINIEKVELKTIANTIAITNSIIIAFVSSVISNIDSIILSIVVSFVTIMILIYSLYELAGRYIKKIENKKGEDEKCITQKKSKKNGKNIG